MLAVTKEYLQNVVIGQYHHVNADGNHIEWDDTHDVYRGPASPLQKASQAFLRALTSPKGSVRPI